MMSVMWTMAHAATWLDPALKWRTIETPHFSIHYYDKTEAQAKRMVAIAEEVHSRLSPILKHDPDLKTDVVLLDITDYTNGYTTVIPSPTITLYMCDIGSNLRPVAYETWLKYVFLHEYTHVLHLDTVEGSGKLFNFLFGRVTFPNGLMPNFMIEGMATYFETRHGYRGGRGDDPRWQAMMRMDVLDNNLKSIDQASVDTVKWPVGSLRYLYGVYFLQYLSDKYGEEKIVEMSQMYGDFFFSGEGMDGLCRYVYGKNLNDLWKEWIENLKAKYGEEKKRIEKAGVTSYQRLTDRGYYILKPAWSEDSSGIYYQQNDEDGYPAVHLVGKDGKNDRKIFEGMVMDDSLSVRNGKLYFAKGGYYRNFYYYKDIYSLDTGTRKLVRLTDGERAADPAVSPDGGTMVYVKNGEGKRTLWSYDLASKNERMIGQDAPDVQYFSPAFSPDGTKIAVAKWTDGGSQEIYLIDRGTGAERKLAAYGLSANPGFAPDGKYVIFDADGNGICDLYACEVATGKLFKITNVLGAAMMPAVSPDGGKIAFIDYSSKGHDLAVMGYDPSSWKPVDPAMEPRITERPKTQVEELNGVISAKLEGIKPPTWETEVHDYNPWPKLLPKFWIPYSFTDENGTHMLAYTGGTDPLGQHYAQLQFGYDWAVNRSSYALYYVNNQFLPQLSFDIYDAVSPYSWDNDSRIYWERERGADLACSFFKYHLLHEYDGMSISFGYEFEDLTNASSVEILSQMPSRGKISGAQVGWHYSSVRQYGYSVVPEDGTDLMLKARFFRRSLGSDYTFDNYSVTAAEYFGLGSHHAIALKGWGSYLKGDQIVQEGYTWNSVSVRGYPGTNFSGSKMLKGSVEYSFPLLLIESGWGYGLTFFDRLWGTLFFEEGGATYGGLGSVNLYRGYGGEIALNTANMYGYVPFSLKVGYANGIDRGGGQQIYFTVGM